MTEQDSRRIIFLIGISDKFFEEMKNWCANQADIGEPQVISSSPEYPRNIELYTDEAHFEPIIVALRTDPPGNLRKLIFPTREGLGVVEDGPGQDILNEKATRVRGAKIGLGLLPDQVVKFWQRKGIRPIDCH